MIIDINDASFFYQDTAADIVNSILNLMKSGVKEHESYAAWNYDIPISDEEEKYVHFNWYFSIDRIDEMAFPFCKKYDIIGSAGRDYFDEPSIEITIILCKGLHQKKIEILYAELFDVVAHELHHIAQNIDNNHYDYLLKEEGKLSYFLDPSEIEAFHIGIRAHAYLSDRSFEEIATSYIQITWPAGTESEILRVVKAWKETTFPIYQQNLGSSWL